MASTLQELDAHRDRATSLALELEDVKTALDAKEREIEELLADLDERDQVHREEVQRVAEEWREEVDEAKDREREARQVRLVPSLVGILVCGPLKG